MIFGPLFMTWVSLNSHTRLGLTLWLEPAGEVVNPKKRGNVDCHRLWHHMA